MVKNVSIFCTLLVLPFLCQAQVNFSEHIAPIIYNNCTNCHRPGEVGPMSFTNYEEVASWANMIRYVTETEYMPPYPPDVDYASYVGERKLTDEQIELIAAWVDAGVPEGNPALEPELPNFPTGSQIGVPDLVLEMSESHAIEGNNKDDYRVFVLPSGLIEDQEIASMEFRPGNNRAVHHVLFAYDISGVAAAKDAQTPEYGYESFGDFGIDESERLSWGYVPGTIPLIYPEGIGQIIPAGADILIQVHYAPLSTNETDLSRVNIFFKDANDPIDRPVKTGGVLPLNLPGGWQSFRIPANEVTTFVGEGIFTRGSLLPNIDEDISLISVQPHAHYLGKSYEIYVVTPESDTINLLKIDDWDFNWQGSYTFDRMKKIPANSEWFTIATYDNRAENPNNPSNPPINVRWGESTVDEMFLVGFDFVPYEDGDEDIVIGDGPISSVEEIISPTNSELYTPSPNPSSGRFSVSFQLEKSETLSIELTQMDGRTVQQISTNKKWSPGLHTLEVEPESISPGIYLVRLKGAGYVLSKRFILVR